MESTKTSLLGSQSRQLTRSLSNRLRNQPSRVLLLITSSQLKYLLTIHRQCQSSLRQDQSPIPQESPSPAPNSAAQAGNRSQQRRKIANFFATIWQDDSDNEDDFESDDDKSVAEDGHSWADKLGDDEYCEDFINQRKCGIHIRFDLGLMGLPVEWAEKITVSCTVDGKPVGHGLGGYIKRSLITQDFWERMTQGEDPGLSTLALELFD